MGLLATATVVLASAAALILVAYLARRPRLTAATKVWLLFGIGVLPIAAAFTGNVSGFEASTERKFCGSCHTMDRFAMDAANLESTTLAAKHSRNKMHGEQSCYVCHKEYGMFGTVATKLSGLSHMWVYYTGDAGKAPKLYKPYTNEACTQCHSMTLPAWKEEPEHESVMADIQSGEVTCATSGCHGPAHPEVKKEAKTP